MLNNRENPRVSPFVQLALCTSGILVLELAIIRWMSSQMRIVAYFSNIVLLASFLGMGLGVALGRRRSNLVQYCLPAVAALSLVLAYSFTGLIFSLLLKRSQDPPAALGSNLLGGVLEYSSRVLGMKAPVLPAIGFYLASYIVAFRWSPRFGSPVTSNSCGNSAV